MFSPKVEMQFRYLVCSIVILAVLPATVFAQSVGVLANAVAPLTTPTPDGSGQVTEPSIVQFPFRWHGFKYWLVLAPFPHSDAADENPSILVSDDGQHWSIPPGGRNPIQEPAPLSHLADSSLFFDLISDQLWLYYISEDQFGITNVLRTVSGDGIHWSTPQVVLRAPDYQVVMPAVAKIGDQYWLWSVNAGNAGCSASSTFVQYRTSSDGVHWSPPQLTDIAQPGFRIWHIGVTELHFLISRPGGSNQLTNDGRLPDQFPENGPPSDDQVVLSPPIYAMLASAYENDCGDTVLFLSLSQDGVHWGHFPRPLLTPDHGHWDGQAIYQSTMALDSATDLMTVWYSAWTPTQEGPSWHLGVTQGNYFRTLHDLLEVPAP